MPRPHHPKYPAWSGESAARKVAKEAAAARGSWWADFARGERRDQQFMAKASSLVPRQTDTMTLKIWVQE